MTKKLSATLADQLARAEDDLAYARRRYENSPWTMGSQRRRELEVAKDRVTALRKKAEKEMGDDDTSDHD